MKKLTQQQLRSLIVSEAKKNTRKPKSLATLLFEEEKVDMKAIAQDAGAKPVTLIVLYGPPAALSLIHISEPTRPY